MEDKAIVSPISANFLTASPLLEALGSEAFPCKDLAYTPEKGVREEIHRDKEKENLGRWKQSESKRKQDKNSSLQSFFGGFPVV